MTTAAYTKPERIDLRTRAEYDEKWVQKIVAADPAVLGLGNLALLDQERRQPQGGRLDLLLQEREATNRYEVELQLGPTDESHIIRTIEYWDVERRRFPQYDHCAVLVAEQVTSRFLNVISLFNGALPLIAIQMQAFAVGEHVTLVFTTVLDKMVRGLADEDEATAPTDRADWEAQSSKKVVSLVDDLLDLIRQFDESLELKYTKFYIGLARHGRPFNVVKFRPRKNHIILELQIPKDNALDKKIDETDLETLDHRRGMYRLRVTKEDIAANADFLTKLMNMAHARRTGP